MGILIEACQSMGYDCYLLSDVGKKVLMVALVGCLTWRVCATRLFFAPVPKLCGSPGGPPITTTRVKLRDGRHLAYKEYGVPKDRAKHKFIYVHSFGNNRESAFIATQVSHDIIERTGSYIVGFDRPGYGESGPDPKRTVKSMALDIEDLADQLGLGPKFYVVGYSMGGEFVWGCLRYIPHRLAGVTMVAPVINYWWPGLPAKLLTEAYYKQPLQDQWALRVAHYTPWLTYWWQTQKLFPSSSVISSICSMPEKQVNVIQQGEYESLHRDMMIGFGKWEFSPVEVENPFPDSEGTVHIWHGAEDVLVPTKLQRYIAQRLPWIHYHELPGEGHSLPHSEGVSEAIIKAQLSVD